MHSIGHLNVSVYLLFICFKSFLSWKFESGFHWYFHCVHSFDANEHFQSSEWLNSKKFAIWITIFRHNSLPFEWKSEIKGDLYQILSAPFTIWAIFDTNQFSLVRKILIFSKTNLLTTNQLKYCQLLSMAHFLLNESNFMSIAFHVWLIKSIYWQSFYSIFIFILWNYCSEKRMERKWWTVICKCHNVCLKGEKEKINQHFLCRNQILFILSSSHTKDFAFNRNFIENMLKNGGQNPIEPWSVYEKLSINSLIWILNIAYAFGQ